MTQQQETLIVTMVGGFLNHGMEHPWEWRYFIADPQHSGNDPRRMSIQQIILSFGAIISAPSL